MIATRQAAVSLPRNLQTSVGTAAPYRGAYVFAGAPAQHARLYASLRVARRVVCYMLRLVSRHVVQPPGIYAYAMFVTYWRKASQEVMSTPSQRMSPPFCRIRDVLRRALRPAARCAVIETTPACATPATPFHVRLLMLRVVATAHIRRG